MKRRLDDLPVRHVHSSRVDAKIAAAVEAAPLLPGDVADLWARLVRTAPPARRSGAAA